MPYSLKAGNAASLGDAYLSAAPHSATLTSTQNLTIRAVIRASPRHRSSIRSHRYRCGQSFWLATDWLDLWLQCCRVDAIRVKAFHDYLGLVCETFDGSTVDNDMCRRDRLALI